MFVIAVKRDCRLAALCGKAVTSGEQEDHFLFPFAGLVAVAAVTTTGSQPALPFQR